MPSTPPPARDASRIPPLLALAAAGSAVFMAFTAPGQDAPPPPLAELAVAIALPAVALAVAMRADRGGSMLLSAAALLVTCGFLGDPSLWALALAGAYAACVVPIAGWRVGPPHRRLALPMTLRIAAACSAASVAATVAAVHLGYGDFASASALGAVGAAGGAAGLTLMIVAISRRRLASRKPDAVPGEPPPRHPGEVPVLVFCGLVALAPLVGIVAVVACVLSGIARTGLMTR